MKILYLHGLYSKPGGVKPTFLRGHGHEVVNPALPDDDFALSVRIAQAAYDESRPEVVVGSSRGGAVALGIDSGQTPMVLIAPAWKRWGSAEWAKAGTIILHSENDEVIPIEDSRALLRASGLPASALVVVGRDHLMIDEAAFEALLTALERAKSVG
jgi:alpha-beta hydrolase superfamily lysophospholipase